MLCGGIKPQNIRPSDPGTTWTETVYDFKMFKPNSKMKIPSLIIYEGNESRQFISSQFKGIESFTSSHEDSLKSSCRKEKKK